MSHLHSTSSPGRNRRGGLLPVLTAGFLAAGSAFAQHSEPAAVLRLDVSSNATVQTSLPFEPFDGSLSALLSDQLTGNANEAEADRILAWDAAAQEYLIAYKAQDGTWLESGTNSIPAVFALTAGDGFFVENRHGPQTILLAGQLSVDADTLQTLEPGFNLAGLPQVASLSLNQSELFASAANGADSAGSADQIITVDGATNWLLSSTGHLLDGNWVTGTGTLSSASFSTGKGFWYLRRGSNSLEWLEANPASALSTSTNQPVIADIVISNGTVILSIDAIGYNPVELFHQDVAQGQSFPVDGGWQLADENLSGGTNMLWTDTTLTNFNCRIYVAAVQIDTDADQLSDARESLIYKTDATLADTDADGADDGFEVLTSLTEPLNPDTDADGMSDGSEIYHAANPLASNAYARLPWSEPFDGLTAGTLDGQNGWQADSATVQTNRTAQGSKALELTAAHASDQALQTFGAYGITNIWIDMMLQPQPGALPEADEITGRSAALLAADPAGYLSGYDGTFQEWVTSSNMPAATGQWLRVTMGLDYHAKTWRLNVDNILMAQNLGFKDNQTPELTHAAWKNSVLGNAYLDEVSIVTSEPGHLDDDGDTLPNVWEKTQGLDANDATDAAQDSDGDALSNADEYAAGTDALNADTDNDALVDGMETLFAEDPVSSNQYQQVPWNTGFESGEGYTLGNADGQAGWNATPQDAAVITDGNSALGTNSLLIKSSATQTALIDHWSVSATGCVIWSEMHTRTVPAPLPQNSETTGNSALFMLEGSHHFAVYDGTAGNWIILSNTPAVDHREWQQLAVRADYAAATWSLYWNNEPIIKNIGFADPSLKQMVRFALKGGNSLGDGFDALNIDTEKPLTIDEDADGLTDRTEDANQNGFVDAGETDPFNPDSDGDRMIDGNETLFAHDPVSSNTFATIPWTTGFESADGFTTGSLNGQGGWVATAATVQQDDSVQGVQAITLAANPAGAEARKDLGTWPEKVLWFDSYAKLQPGQLPDPSTISNAAVLVALNPEGLLSGWDSEAEQWVTSPIEYTADPNEWTRLTFCVDYNHKIWTAYIGSVRIFRDISFADSTLRSLARIAMRQPASSPLTGSSKWDQLALVTTEPALLDNDGDGLPNTWEILHGFDPENPQDGAADDDDDGLLNSEEYVYGTNPFTADTDNDGISDYTEINITHTAPASNDYWTITTVDEVNGCDATNTLGTWIVDGTALYASDCRGYVEYAVYAPTGDMYRLEINATQNRRVTLDKTIEILVYIDNEYLGRKRFSGSYGSTGTVHVITPWIQTGTHSIRIYWDNEQADTSLRVLSLKLQEIQGAVTNGNGTKDWVEHALREQCSVNTNRITSQTSPVCIEGNARYLSMMDVNDGCTPRHALSERWYADVSLSETGGTDICVSFQNGGYIVTQRMEWTATDLLQSSDIIIRKGDALLLTAVPPDATNGTIHIDISGHTNRITDIDTPVSYCFETTGVFTVCGTYMPEQGNVQSNTITVTAVDWDFGSAPSCWSTRKRNWQCTALPDQVHIEHDDEVNLHTAANSNGMWNCELSLSREKSCCTIARLDEEGPILANTEVRPINIYSTVETYVHLIETYPDGSQLIETGIVISPIVEDVTIRLELFVGGVTFEDGTVVKTLTAEEFDELGIYRARFIRGSGVDTSICHLLQAFQNGIQIGVR
jgi:hypothetical protein